MSNNTVRASELPDLIPTVHASLSKASSLDQVQEPAIELKPAVPIKKSVMDDFLIGLEDGRKFRSMKRHLGLLGMTPDDYRAKWGLPRDYPMVAPGYAAKRSELVKATGLGNSRRAAATSKLMNGTALEPVVDQAPTLAPVVAEPAPELGMDQAPRRRGRPQEGGLNAPAAVPTD